MAENIIAIPTLVRSAPGPLLKVIGNLSDTSKLTRGLGVQPQDC